jgi:hypothetical protein
MLRLLLTITLPFYFSAALAAPTPVGKAEPFKVNLILKTVDGRALQHGYKAGLDLQTGKITTLSVKDWNGVELVAGDVISLISHDETVQAERLAGSQKLVWQTTQTKPQTRFVLRKVEGSDGSPIATGDRVRLQLFGDKDSYLSSNAELVHVTTPGPDQTWLVRRETYGNQAARKLYWDAGMCSFGELAKSKALYEEAFKLGALDAAHAIGDMYLDGKFGSKDLAQAAAYYRKGAEAGVPSAMYLYGVMLYYGKGVSENKREGVRWEQIASQADYYPATDKLKEWGEPLPGVAASAVPKPTTPVPVWKPRWEAGTFFGYSDGRVYAVITKVDHVNKRYLLLTRTWYEKQEPYYLTAQEFGHFVLAESWVTDDFKGVATTAKYRACDQCGGEACQYVEGGRARGGQWESVGYNVQVYTPRRVPLSYTKVVCCGGCGGAGWIKR